MQDPLNFMYLMTAKICHDIAAPLGALNIGLETVFDSIKPDSPLNEFKEILLSSYQSTQIKLKFYRSFLSSQPDGPSLQDIQNILKEFCILNHINLKQFDIESNTLDGNLKRLLFGLGFLTAETLLKGGELYLKIQQEKIYTEAIGPSIQLRTSYKEVFLNSSNCSEESVQTILPHYLEFLAQQANKNIVLDDKNKHKLTITVS